MDSTVMEVQKALKQEITSILSEIWQNAHKNSQEGWQNTSFLSRNGKLVRTNFMLQLFQAISQDIDKQNKEMRANLVACCTTIELIHTASLIHDDIIDESPHRRGLKTVHSALGNKNAVLLGDAILARSISIIGNKANLSERKKCLIYSKISTAIENLVLGEMKDLQSSQNSLSLNKYNNIISMKTASLFVLGAQIVSIIISDEEEGKAKVGKAELVINLEEIASLFGQIFQMKDDIADWNDYKQGNAKKKIVETPGGNHAESNSVQAKESGKKPFSDIRQGRKTLPLILLEKESPRFTKNIFEQMVAGHRVNNPQIRQILKEMNKVGIPQACQKEVGSRIAKIKHLINKTIQHSPGKDVLIKLCSEDL